MTTSRHRRVQPRKIVLLVDSREKLPLLFPRWMKVADDLTSSYRVVEIQPRRSKLEWGDYCLEGAESLAVVERKGSLLELASNFLGMDRGRAARAFSRLAVGARYPYLLCDFTPAELLGVRPGVADPWRAASRFFEAVVAHKLRLIWAPQCRTPRTRVNLGECIARILLAHKEYEESTEKIAETVAFAANSVYISNAPAGNAGPTGDGLPGLAPRETEMETSDQGHAKTTRNVGVRQEELVRPDSAP